MEKLTVVSTIVLPWILGNLSTVSISFSNGKSNRCFKNFLAVHLAKLSIVSIFFSNGKSNRRVKNVLAVHFSQSIHSFNLDFKW